VIESIWRFGGAYIAEAISFDGSRAVDTSAVAAWRDVVSIFFSERGHGCISGLHKYIECGI